MDRLDHLILVAPALEAGISAVEARLGVRAALGGKHPGRGTHNALLGLGEGRYLEIMAKDPDQTVPQERRFLKLAEGTPLRLATWVAKARDLEAVARRARAAGVELGKPKEGGRTNPDGSRLSWRLLGADAPRLDGLVPFFIDWGDSPHPSASAPAGCLLRGLRALHPRPASVRAALQALELELAVDAGESPALIASLECPRGPVELR